MKFKEQLQKKLKGKLTDEELELLPSGFQFIGDIIILNLNPVLLKHKKEIGNVVLEINKRAKTVCNRTGKIIGEFREPQIEVIAGSKNTIATIKENKCLYKFDVTKLMFAKGNINERARISKQIKPGELIVDMFAGLGYFSVPIGKLSKASKIYSIELNPNAFFALKENLKLNKIEDRFEIFNEDNRKVIPKLIEKGIRADRVIMGYLPPPMEFVDSALSIVKKNGIIHYECLLNEDKEKRKEEINKILEEIRKKAEKLGKRVRLLSVNYVKGYAPRVNHEVLDLKIF